MSTCTGCGAQLPAKVAALVGSSGVLCSACAAAQPAREPPAGAGVLVTLEELEAMEAEGPGGRQATLIH